MRIMLEKLKAPCFFETSEDPALWWALVDNMKLELGNHRYAICVQTGQIKRFPVETFVTKISLNIIRA